MGCPYSFQNVPKTILAGWFQSTCVGEGVVVSLGGLKPCMGPRTLFLVEGWEEVSKSKEAEGQGA